MSKKRYPFKFLDAYTREDKDIFFGRQAEVDLLYEMIYQADLILLYGVSGAGKTSMIQCGLASKFKDHAWLPLPVRRGINLNDSLEKALLEADVRGDSQDQGEEEDDMTWFDSEDTLTAQALSPLAQKFKNVYLRHFRPIYLIFDQFEELYILGDAEEQAKFIGTIQEILRMDQPIKIIFSIREEYLGYLYEFEKAVPELLRKKLRVEPMNLDKVRNMLQELSQLPDSLVKFPDSEEELNRLADTIFDRIKGDSKSLSIQLPYLQVFLDSFYISITGDETRQSQAYFTLEALEKMGDIDNILADFLDEQVTKIAHSLAVKEVRIWEILSFFVTLEGTKEPLPFKKLVCHVDEESQSAFIKDALAEMIQRRILRILEGEDELYEVAHDSLAQQITKKRTDEQTIILEIQRLIRSQAYAKEDLRDHFTQKQLNFIEPYETKIALDERERNWIKKSRAYHKEFREKEKKKKEKAWIEKTKDIRTKIREEERKKLEKEEVNSNLKVNRFSKSRIFILLLCIVFPLVFLNTLFDFAQNRIPFNLFTMLTFGAGALGGLLSMYLPFRKLRSRLTQAENQLKDKQHEVEEILSKQQYETMSAIMEGQELERNRIAQVLHDNLGSMLSIVKFHFNSVNEQLQSTDTQNQETYEKAFDLLNKTSEEVRRISYDLSSNSIERFGLSTALQELKKILESSQMIEVDLVEVGMEGKRLNVKLELIIYRTVQELVSNVLKHAEATDLEIQVFRRDEEGELIVIVVDNGKGFDREQVKESKSLGLDSIDKRITQLGGHFHVDTSPGQGTKVTIHLPI